MSKIVKNTTLIGLLDLIAPHSCRGCGRLGDVLCDRCKKYILDTNFNLCPHCYSKITATKCQKCKTLPSTFVIGERSGLLNDLIHDYKYHSTRALAAALADLLNARLPDFKEPIIIVPLPTATNHIRGRGFDHTLLLAKKLAHLRHYKVARLLIRNQNTVQVGADKKTRLKQADSAYQISPTAKIDPSATYLLLDDVWTTGASMQTAIKKLSSAGAKHLKIALLAVSTLD